MHISNSDIVELFQYNMEEDHHDEEEGEMEALEEDGNHEAEPVFSKIKMACPALPEEEYHVFIEKVNTGVPCETMESLQEEEAQCCERLRQVWVQLNDLYEDKLLSSIQQPHQMLVSKEFSRKTLSTLGEFGKREPHGIRSLTPLINDCKIWSYSGTLDCTQHFRVGPSVNGLVYSLNRPQIGDVVTPEANSLFVDKLANDKSSNSTGQKFSPGQFVLSTNLVHNLASKSPGPYPTFNLMIHDANEVPDFMGNVIKLEAGKSYSLKIKPVVTIADSSIDSMSVEQRHCAFRNEHKLKLFKSYTRSACLLECQIENILKSCHCLPWDLIHHKEYQDVAPCVLSQLQCPQAIIDQASDHDCDCPFDCNTVKYSYSIQHSCFSPRKMCMELEEDPSTNYFGMLGNWDNVMPKQKHFNPCYTIDNKGVNLVVSYEDSIAQKITKIKRITFAGMLSNLGTYVQSHLIGHVLGVSCQCYFFFFQVGPSDSSQV